jgi:hypothetical protein
MRLSTFIHDTLYEIALGVTIGRARALDMVAVMPGHIDGTDVAEKTYVDFDIAVVVDEDLSGTSTKDGNVGAEIQVVSMIKIKAGAGVKNESVSHKSQEQTHRITFKIPIHMNAHFKDNPKAIAEASKILKTHGFFSENESS